MRRADTHEPRKQAEFIVVQPQFLENAPCARPQMIADAGYARRDGAHFPVDAGNDVRPFLDECFDCGIAQMLMARACERRSFIRGRHCFP